MNAWRFKRLFRFSSPVAMFRTFGTYISSHQAEGMPSSAVDDILYNIPVIKCVVVGDTAVGKTKLICQQTQGTVLTLDQIIAKHIPTIWAIDHYRKNREVQARSILNVDGVKISLHLWDTFGDHDKDRKYAYQKANVALLCYDISSPKSFQHVKTKWYPEIRRFCPSAPILLLGCKNDMRYLHNDPDFIQYCKDKNPYIKKVSEENIICREQGRQLAQEIGAVCYYEASSYTEYGLNFVFENIVRIALISRRREKFWLKKWRNVTSPALQSPYCPPKPDPPALTPVPPSSYRRDIANLMRDDYGPDFKFRVNKFLFYVHRIVLAATSTYFKELFVYLNLHNICELDLPSIQRMGLDLSMKSLTFQYTGSLGMNPNELLVNYIDVRNVTDLKELKEMICSKDDEELDELKEVVWDNFIGRLQNGLYDLGLQKRLFVDVAFEVDDGLCYAHRSILLARCEFMRTMFSENFVERSLKIVVFPDTKKEAFDICLQYLYTDSIVGSVNLSNAMEVIVLANRLCLFRLVTLVELLVIDVLNRMIENNKHISDFVLLLLEPCELHNAFQLFDFCQYYIITNYHEISIFSTDLLEDLREDTQDRLKKYRWPPIDVVRENLFFNRSFHSERLSFMIK